MQVGHFSLNTTVPAPSMMAGGGMGMMAQRPMMMGSQQPMMRGGGMQQIPMGGMMMSGGMYQQQQTMMGQPFMVSHNDQDIECCFLVHVGHGLRRGVIQNRLPSHFFSVSANA